MLAGTSPRVAFVAVNYRTAEAALVFARRFDGSDFGRPSDCRLILVDNTEVELGGELGKRLRGIGSTAICVEGGGNLGYFGGARRGLEVMRGLGWTPDWIVVSNVDLELDPQSLSAVVSQCDAGSIGVIAPGIRSSLTRRELNPFLSRRPSVLRMQAYKHIFSHYTTMLLYEGLARAIGWLLKPLRRRSSGSSLSGQAIYAPHGSIMIMSREYFRRGGSLEHPPFLFGEEITVAESARAMQLPVHYMPQIRVVHNEHASIASLPSRRVQGFLRESSAYCADRYFPI